jgi:hypothetical protein
VLGIVVYSVKCYGSQISTTAVNEIQTRLLTTKSTISNNTKFNNNLRNYNKVDEQQHVNTPYTIQVYNKVLLNSKTSHNNTNMRNTKIAAVKPYPTERDNKVRTRSLNATAKTEGKESGEILNPETDLPTKEEIPMFTDAQQEFINQAIAQTRRQTLAENEISRDDERHYYEKQLQEIHERILNMQQDQREQMIQMARQAHRDLPHSHTSSSVENPKHAFETPKVQRPQDKAYQAILTANKERPLDESLHTVHSKPCTEESQTTTDMMQIYDTRMNNLCHPWATS